MTPKEKAEDLLLKYSILKDGHNDLVKQCALIAIDEIINSVDDEHVSDIFNEYWEEVTHEISNL
jgi:hypothetical protein